MQYIVNLQRGTEITLGLPYGTVTLTHGQVIPESIITKSYPELFIAIPDTVQEVAPVDAIIEKIKEQLNSSQNDNPAPKKAGRPPKSGFSNKGK